MMTTDHLEKVSMELCRIEELIAALDLASDCLERGDSQKSMLAHDATIGLVRALHDRMARSHATLNVLFDLARAQEKDAA